MLHVLSDCVDVLGFAGLICSGRIGGEAHLLSQLIGSPVGVSTTAAAIDCRGPAVVVGIGLNLLTRTSLLSCTIQWIIIGIVR